LLCTLRPRRYRSHPQHSLRGGSLGPTSAGPSPAGSRWLLPSARRLRRNPQLACEHGVEGTVSKRINGRYEPDRRTWLKIKCLNREEFVVIERSRRQPAAHRGVAARLLRAEWSARLRGSIIAVPRHIVDTRDLAPPVAAARARATAEEVLAVFNELIAPPAEEGPAPVKMSNGADAEAAE
jgi:hypothetical protein